MSVTSETGFQQLWVQIQLNKLRSIVLCVAYRPDYCPVSCFVDDFMDKYSQALRDWSKSIGRGGWAGAERGWVMRS